jgi:RHS repeat-associated protein
VETDWLFTSKERDAETGLDYFGARYFSSAQGRFTSVDGPFNDQDPSDPQSWNLFSYVRNNPLKFTDPSGQDCVYTSNLSSDGTVGVERGSCSQSGGTFVDGTIDTNSLTYNQRASTLSYSYSNGETIGAGVIGGLPAPDEFPGIQGPANAAGAQRIVNGAGPVVDALGQTMKFGASLAFPLTNLAVDLAVGSDSTQSAAQAAMSRKPGSLGKFKSADALRRENKIARDIIKQLNLTGKRAEQVHQLIQGYSIDAGYVAEFPELLKYVREVLGLL